MPASQQLFDKSGGYRRLHSFTFATMIHLETISFCKRFIPWQEDQLGKTAGQMIGAARSGRQNIIEGSERSATSKETEIKLTDVARASLAELLGDYEIYLAEKAALPWGRDDHDRQKFASLMLPEFHHGDDSLHNYWKYYQDIRPAFAPWFDHQNSTMAANAMIVLIQRTMAMLSSQIRHQGGVFLNNGGFRERMYQCRSNIREENHAADKNAPNCPDCSKPMRRRSAQKGTHAGSAFWGCSAYPECKGIRKIEK